MERWSGDRRFRQELEDSEDLEGLAARYGLEVDLSVLGPLYDPNELEKLNSEGADKGAFSPLVSLWHRYSKQLLRFRDEVRSNGDCPEHHPGFHAWRQRQIHRVETECGPSSKGIVHPVVAFELADGCSVGCWFCGISADKFNGHWPYSSENADLWRGILQGLKIELGPALRSGFLYWATDPLDNPDYPKFLEDFYQATELMPQTTTAIPLRDLELTRAVMACFEQHRHVINRFSVLTTKILDRIHEAFDARELLGVELVLQMKDSSLSKSLAGRARERNLRRNGNEPVDPSIESSTIACVTGFLVNMPKRTIRLVSPCRPSDRWPDGYKIWDTRTFQDAESFHQEIRSLIDEHVLTRPEPNHPIRFREDLRFEALETGFRVSTATRKQEIRGPSLSTKVGRLIDTGDETHGSLRAKMIQDGANILVLEILLERIFELGLLMEPLDLSRPATDGLLVSIGATAKEMEAPALG